MPLTEAQLAEATAAVADWLQFAPRAAVILGTGLGGLARHIERAANLPYAKIPHFPTSTAPGHRGCLHAGMIEGVPVLVMEGRFHTYEGHSAALTSLPVHVLAALGVNMLIVSSAAGGMNPAYRAGDVMVIDDHINMMRCGIGACVPGNAVDSSHDNAGRSLTERPIYDAALAAQALEVARSCDFVCHRGVYVAVRGPNFETRAEYRMFRRLGGDVVGMSTVPEVLAAAQLDLRVLAISTVTNVCLPDALKATSSEAVLAAAQNAAEKVRRLIWGVLRAATDTASRAT